MILSIYDCTQISYYGSKGDIYIYIYTCGRLSQTFIRGTFTSVCPADKGFICLNRKKCVALLFFVHSYTSTRTNLWSFLGAFFISYHSSSSEQTCGLAFLSVISASSLLSLYICTRFWSRAAGFNDSSNTLLVSPDWGGWKKREAWVGPGLARLSCYCRLQQQQQLPPDTHSLF